MNARCFLPFFLLMQCLLLCCECLKKTKQELRLEVMEMIHHAFDNYMENAYPGDELMPLSCAGRVRGKTKDRGDIDDSLGNFALTLVDSLDTLAVIGDVDRFEAAVTEVINNVKFDSNLVVSVFETNIRVLGGLIGGHVMAKKMKFDNVGMSWYKDELLYMAIDIANRLLPAFNTTTGVPYSRVNLKYGLHHPKAFVKNDGTTCTACAGTFLLEFAALSRLMGDSVYESKARAAMDYIWSKRSRTSDLVGTILNIKTGEWIKKSSGLGAGIDSYYEYIFKAYVMLGDWGFLDRFNKHYKAIKKYIHEGPLLLNVNMQNPDVVSRSHVDALSAFWPAIQVMKGDIKSAIEVHEIFYQVIKMHRFLPEAFNSEFNSVWHHHPIRPEFVESTYFLYRATRDAHYLDVAEYMVDAIQNHTRVPCGFAAISNVKTGAKEDRFDSFVIAETFKYLYLIFTDDDQLWFKVDDFVFSTEAHLLPINWKAPFLLNNVTKSYHNSAIFHNMPSAEQRLSILDSIHLDNTCQNYDFPNNPFYASEVRKSFRGFVNPNKFKSIPLDPVCVKQTKANPASQTWTFTEAASPSVQILRMEQNKPTPTNFVPISVHEFDSNNPDHYSKLAMMGIEVFREADGNLQLQHTYHKAYNPSLAKLGLQFIQEAWQINEDMKKAPKEAVVQILTPPYFGSMVFKVGTALFGYDLQMEGEVAGYVMIARPSNGCSVDKDHDITGYIVLAVRGTCLFAEKARAIEERGGIGLIVVDSVEGTSILENEVFSMSADSNPQPIGIPTVFCFQREGIALLSLLIKQGPLFVRLASQAEYYEVISQFYEMDGSFDKFLDVRELHVYSNKALGEHFSLSSFEIGVSLEQSFRPSEELLFGKEIDLTEVEFEKEKENVADVGKINKELHPKTPFSEVRMAANSLEVDDDIYPPAFALAKSIVTKHIVQMAGVGILSTEDQESSGDSDEELAAVFYSQIPTLGMKVTWFFKSGSSLVNLLDNMREEHKTIIKSFRSQKFTKIQIDRMSNGVARLIGVEHASVSELKSDYSLPYGEDKMLAELMGEVVESIFVDLFSSKVTVN